LLLFGLQVTGQDKIRAGEVCEKVVCQDDPAESYALYLPAGYSPEKKWPILYAFDPGAQGRIPVERYGAVAERYGYIVAGSNNAQNGPWEPILHAVNAVWRDTHSRFRVDENRVYVTGFSGGARAASRLPKLSQAAIAGVIGCGAGLAVGEKLADLRGAYYCGVVGRIDFNYAEMRRLSAEMEARAILHRLVVFEGGHSWPPAEAFQKAVEWMEVLAIKQGLRPRNEKLVGELFLKETAEAQALEQSGKLIDAANSYGSVIGAFKGLADTSDLEARREQLRKSDSYQRALREESADAREELATRTRLNKVLSRIDRDKSDLLNLEKALKDLKLEPLLREIDEDKDTRAKLVSYRCLQSVGLDCRLKGFAALNSRDAKRAIVFFEIAVRVAKGMPGRLEYLYFYLASAYALDQNKDKALACLAEAVKAGFKDVGMLEKERNFDSLRTTKGFQDILDALKQ